MALLTFEKMTPFSREKRCCGITLRPLCMVIGYLHLISSVTDIAYHLFTVAVASNGFQCDIIPDSLTQTTMPWIEPLLLVLNLGTHGFYPFPRIVRNQYSMYVEHMPVTTVPRCYPGMLHVSLVDVLNFLINLIWMRIVFSYIGALHKKNPEPMRMFFSLSIVKLVMQIMYLGYQPQSYNVFALETYWFLKVIDIMISVIFLVIVKKYINALKEEQASQNIEKPPSYIECLINANIESLRYKGPKKYEKKEQVETVTDEKKSMEVIDNSTQNPV